MEVQLVQIDNNQVVVSSRQIAKDFGKEHSKVIRSIEEIRGVAKIGDTKEMFYESTYIHPQNGQEYPEYLMNRDGFSLLVMGFTGSKALEWKVRYIQAFNAMEAKLAMEHQDSYMIADPIARALKWAIGRKEAEGLAGNLLPAGTAYRGAEAKGRLYRQNPTVQITGAYYGNSQGLRHERAGS